MIRSRRCPALWRVLEMNLLLLLTLAVMADRGHQQNDAHRCPDGCFCSFPPAGGAVVCSHHSLTDFPSDRLPVNTTQLSIQSVNLTGVTSGHLSLLPHLEKLQLYDTNLRSLSPDLLAGVPRLNTLDLTGNRLVRLPRGIFSRASLLSLVMKNNLLEEARADWFPLNSSITWLDLSGNRLTNVSAETFRRLPRLEDLDLSDNDLQELQAPTLMDLPHLVTVNLAGNKLISLEPETFSHNLKLSRVFLQENRLRGLPPALLRGLTNLQLLLLNQNELRSLPTGLLDQTTPSFVVSLTGNPWRCDGGVEYLWRWLREHPHSAIFLEEVTCDAPETFKHKQVVSLTDRQLGLMKI